MKDANAKALDVLSKGATSIGFKIKKNALCCKCVQTLLAGIDLDKVEINIESCPRHAVENAKAIVEYVVNAGKADTFKGSI